MPDRGRGVMSVLVRTRLKRKIKVFLKIIFLISQPKPMLWLLKRTISMRQFFWAPETYICLNWRVRKYWQFYAQKVLLNWTYGKRSSWFWKQFILDNLNSDSWNHLLIGINPFMPNEISHPYQMNKAISFNWFTFQFHWNLIRVHTGKIV